MFVFDSFLESGGEDQKKMRGAVRQLLETPSDERPAISLTPTQKITFDNGTIEEINNIPAIKAAGGYESVMAEARELYIDQALSARQDRPKAFTNVRRCCSRNGDRNDSRPNWSL